MLEDKIKSLNYVSSGICSKMKENLKNREYEDVSHLYEEIKDL